MEEMIKVWFKEGYKDFDSSEGLNRDNPFELKRLNIIVGANNSGKSRFMREFALKIYHAQLDLQPSGYYLNLIDEVKIFLKRFGQEKNIDTNLIVLSNHESFLKNYYLMKKDLEDLLSFYNNRLTTNRFTRTYSDNSEAVELLQAIIQRWADLEHQPMLKKFFSSHNLFYINSLRTLKNLNSSNLTNDPRVKKIIEDKSKLLSSLTTQNNTPIEEIIEKLGKNSLLFRTYQDYNFFENQIISGEDFFEFLTDSLLGMPEERQKVYEYQNKISHYFFNNQDVVIIPNRKDDILQIKIGDDKQFPISQLGDGLQQVIILTYKAFLTIEPSFFFIEEPEMHLHAGYVKQLMKFLLNETDHYYMATSHSNYLLDMINEDKRIALYRVDKESINDDEKNYETVIKRCDGDRTILQTLGVSPSSVFLANCTIWIEGITDRLYFVQYLNKYLEELKITDEAKWQDYSRFIDGYHYAFVEYQGSNLEHWDFEIDNSEEVDSSKPKGLNAVLVTSNALVIADADLKDKPRFNELEQQLGERIIITQGKETENSISKKFLVRKFFEMCPDNGLARQGNKKKLAYSDDYEKYFTDSYQTSSKGVGKYFDNVLSKMRKDGAVPKLGNNEKSFTFSDGKQSTIKGKTGFCQDIVELMQTEDWELTDSAIELCEAIFQHIKDNND